MNRSYRNNYQTTNQGTPQRQTRQSGPVTQYQPIQSNFVKVETLQPAVQTPEPVKPVVPVVATPAPVKPMETTEDGTAEIEAKVKTVNFQSRVKVSAKVKRQRANKRLRRLLSPKTAIIALHELFHKEQGGSEIEIQVSDTPLNNRFEAKATYGNAIFTGNGPSKTAAKNDCAEKVLRAMVVQKMKEHPRKEPAKNGSENEDVAMDDGDEEVPMTHLASFALYKLFQSWAAEGVDVPDFQLPVVDKPAAQKLQVLGNKALSQLPKARTTLPDNASSIHPAMLLQQMRPGTVYQDLGCQGIVPNVIHCVGVTIDGKQFIGNGKSKKLARKEAAKLACMQIWNVTFTLEALQAGGTN